MAKQIGISEVGHHFRKLRSGEQMSEAARKAAEELNIEVPAGHTFVQDHERTDTKLKTINDSLDS